MANRRLLVKRRKAARNIRKITRTMQLIATARFQAAFNRATASKPYTEKLSQLVSDLAAAADSVEHPLMRQGEEGAPPALLLLTSNRGLCGGYNTNVIRATLDSEPAKVAGNEFHVVGKKGVGYLRFIGRELTERHTEIGDAPRFDEVEPIANKLMRRFVAGEIGSLHVGYMKFLSAGRQRPVVEQILPLGDELGSDDDTTGPSTPYEFTPDPQQLLAELLPATVRVRIYQCFTDAVVSEQVARMVAMKAATDAAGDMIKRLTQQYNRARQTAITMELLDIVGGANALAE